MGYDRIKDRNISARAQGGGVRVWDSVEMAFVVEICGFRALAFVRRVGVCGLGFIVSLR